MALVLLDTSVIIDAINRKRGRWELLRALVEAGDNLGCSVMSIAEVHAGMRAHERLQTAEFLDNLEHYDVSTEVACVGGMLKREWAGKGRTISITDTLIAATALVHRLVLATDNRRDFPMPELVFYPLP